MAADYAEERRLPLIPVSRFSAKWYDNASALKALFLYFSFFAATGTALNTSSALLDAFRISIAFWI